MLYKDYRAQLTACPFCSPSREQEKIIANEQAYLTYSLAPYTAHHLLIIPRRHVTTVFDLSKEEHDAIEKLIEQGSALTKKLGHENFSILVREGHNGAKSIEHLHYHIVPDIRIGDLDHAGKERKVMNKDQIAALLSEIRPVL
jgi:diadenosine tetraphosphate (Ap4A) HIT family hydrolase